MGRKKVVKKKTAKRKVAKRTIHPAPKPMDTVETPPAEDPLMLVMHRMLDVVEANTVQVKSCIVIISQMHGLFAQIATTLDSIAATPPGKAPAKRGRKAKVVEEDPPETQPKAPETAAPDVPPEIEETLETSPTTQNINMAMLVKGFEIMKKVIGTEKAHEYLAGFNGCKIINTLEIKYRASFIECSKAYCEQVLLEQQALLEQAKSEETAEVSEESKLDKQDLRNALSNLDKIKGREIAQGVLNSFHNAQKIGDLETSEYAPLIAKCEEAVKS